MEEQMNLDVIMQLIMFGGDAKSNAMEAIQAAKTGDFELAKAKIAEAGASLTKAHHSQTEMLTKEAQGERTELSLLMVHGQDHLMTSIAFTDLAKEIVELYETIKK
ncbi:MAG: PTS lactose/cellobiose transporter subunit IIA [Clostridium sp.]|uniref:PTS lactose/cellobiose transporter subunit IIA n=1 Tax=Clostridium sp. TaxID=1506 RepID=UPI0025B875F6|nr:PTS lactose/cellobiose transporter subunit IIA [Clostridium sp.]MCF0149367.1 PTS lactose/cellobiose transporter subunit IIA [Clostridium sp.]